MNEKDYQNIPAEKFRLANRTDRHDQKFDTKAVGYFGDAWNRFKKNKSSVVAACVMFHHLDNFVVFKYDSRHLVYFLL